MKLKEAKICENGDFEVTFSFSTEEIKELGVDSLWIMHDKNLIRSLLENLHHFDFDKKR